QLVEWEGGRRIHLEGMILENSWNAVAPSSLMISPGNYNFGMHDLSITNSEFRHGPGVTNMLGQYRNQAPPPVRDEFSNNLVWDIGGYADSYQQSGHGWIFQATGGEDMTISHNTILPLRGWLSTVFYAYGSMPN